MGVTEFAGHKFRSEKNELQFESFDAVVQVEGALRYNQALRFKSRNIVYATGNICTEV